MKHTWSKCSTVLIQTSDFFLNLYSRASTLLLTPLASKLFEAQCVFKDLKNIDVEEGIILRIWRFVDFQTAFLKV